MRAIRLLLAVVLATPLAACAPADSPGLPRCTAIERLGLIAQAVPSASYVPCLAQLPAGWSTEAFDVRRAAMTVKLVSDRAQGPAVSLRFSRSCRTAGAAPFPARSLGGRTYLRLRTLRPRFAGTLIDAFPGGCVQYRFDFVRGQHIALMAQLQSAVGFRSRVQLRQELRHRLGVELRS